MDAVTEQGNFEFASEGVSLNWAATYRSKVEGLPCGDAYVARQIGESILFAVVDGSGSGTEAARAAACCVSVLKETKSICLNTLFAEAHHACQGTRGAALAITIVNPSSQQIEWAAVGEVEGLLLRWAGGRPPQTQRVIQKGGTLGYNLPKLICQSHEMKAGDMIIMASDGIRQAYRNEIPVGRTAEALAAEMHSTFGRDNDDAMVLVTKFDCQS